MSGAAGALAQAYTLALEQHRTGRLGEAEAIYRNILEQIPHQPDTLGMLGLLLYQRGAHQDALDALRQAIAVAPQRPDLHARIGPVYRALDRLDEALAAYRQALALGLSDADAFNNMGNLLRQLGRLDEAIASFEAALQLRPDDATILFNLGGTYCDGQRFEAARDSYLRGLQLQPANAMAHNDLGKVYRLGGQVGEAGRCFEQAIALDPTLAIAHSNLAGVHKLHGMPAETVASYRRALECDPAYAAGHSNMLFALQYSDLIDSAALFAEHLVFGERFEAPLKAHWQRHPNGREPGRRLRVGYVSADFNQHAVAHFMVPVLEHHDPAQLEVVCYYNGTRRDPFTERCEAAAASWVPCHALSDQQLAERIRQDRIDILVDLSGHTAGNRLLAFARKPAPLQLTWLGYFGSTGLSAMDYRFTDGVMDPPGLADAIHTETLLRLSHFSPFEPVADCPGITPLPALASGQLMLASLNNLAKLSASVIRLWARILTRLPHARLMLCNLGDSVTAARVHERFAEHGIDPARLALQPWMPMRDYLALHQHIDLALDPFPYNGGTISNHSLWMGVPVVTLAGDRPVGRIGASLMTRAGLPQFICSDGDDYLECVVRMAADLPALNRIRMGMRERLSASLVTGVVPLTREIEQAYRRIWQQWCAQPGNEERIEQARALHQAGQLDAALALYQAVLGCDPGHPAALHLGALIQFQQGQAAQAVQAIRLALRRAPDSAMLCDLGHMLQAQGRLDEALDAYRQAVALDPGAAQAHCNIGNVLQRQGQAGASVAHYRTALDLQPGYAGAHHNLGNSLRAGGELDAALACYRQALACNPALAEAHNNIGVTLRMQGKLDAAAAAYGQALALDPRLADAMLNLAHVDKEQGRLEQAIARLRQLLVLHPEHALANNSLGATLHASGDLAAALACCRRAVALAPGMAEAHLNLGAVYQDMGQLEQGIACYRQALELAPHRPEAHSNLLFALSQLGDAPQQRQDYLAHARRFGRQVAALAAPAAPWQLARPGPGQPLRVGLVSGDLHGHPVGYFLDTVTAHLDARRVQLFAYPTRLVADALSERLRARCTGWQDLLGWSDAAAAQRIRADGIHVLIDLAGHTAHNRLALFAARPAPVQASWLGYWASTGLDAIDFVLADRRAAPAQAAADFAETLHYLPHSRLCFSAPDDAPEPAAAPALASGAVTFGSFQKLGKITDTMLALWGQILQALPQARLHLQNSGLRNQADRAQFERRLTQAGIALAQVRMCAPLARARYLQSYAAVDIVLDTFPFPGGTTTCEALWMGVPTLTLAGQGMLARQGASLLGCVGLDDWIAGSPADYVARALAHAADVDALARLRAGLRARAQASPLFDAARFARDLETALHAMWQTRGMPLAGPEGAPP